MLVLATVAAGADDDHALVVRKPFLWKISLPESDRSEDTRESYLFGTIHVPHQSVTRLHAVAQKAWDEADAALFEIDFLQDRAAQAKAISLPADQRLENLLSENLLSRLDDRLKKIAPATTRAVLPKAHVVVWPLLLGNLQAQAGHPHQLPMDLLLYRAAKLNGKEVGGLEKPEEQLQGIVELPLDDQIAFLKATLDGMDNDDAEQIDRLQQTMKHYASGDADGFGRFLRAEFTRTGLRKELIDSITDNLLTIRNRKMATEIVRRLRLSPKQSFFFAVGVGHLVGDTSVQTILQQQKVTVTRVSIIETDSP